VADDFNKGPQRACRLLLNLQADSREELAGALYNMASRIERGEMSKGVSGGPSSGYIYELVEGEHPTHDDYFQQLTAYLDNKQAAPGVMVDAKESGNG
jgi:hypothetical protein